MFFPCRTDIALSLANLQLEYCILFVPSPHGFKLICCCPLLASPPPAQCLVLHAVPRQCFKSLPFGFACLRVPSKAGSARIVSILPKTIKVFPLTLIEVQSSFVMLLHILKSYKLVHLPVTWVVVASNSSLVQWSLQMYISFNILISLLRTNNSGASCSLLCQWPILLPWQWSWCY